MIRKNSPALPRFLEKGFASLSYYNFEWLASSARSFVKNCPDFAPAAGGCRLQNGIVKIPVSTDDP